MRIEAFCQFRDVRKVVERTVIRATGAVEDFFWICHFGPGYFYFGAFFLLRVKRNAFYVRISVYCLDSLYHCSLALNMA